MDPITTDLQEKRNALARQIQQWCEVQLAYTPLIATLLVVNDTSDSGSPLVETTKSIPLHLPSTVSASLRLDPTIAAKLNVSGTGNKPNTHMRTLHNQMTNKMDQTANCYRAARAMLYALDPTGGDWKEHLHVLNKNNIRGPGKDPDNPTSKGRYEPSWIWLVARVGAGDVGDESEESLNEALRAEWAKSMAR
ncbi:hypothetical protein BYT27DRAFT_7227910 [Phlegmacium glaucopus]|nr:hypothetical protein BYT27DRAFT_7227910 [Phlegmacium glaucopus]